MITPHHKNVTAVHGQPLTLTMEFCANPPYNKVFWIAKDKIIVPGDENEKATARDISVSSHEIRRHRASYPIYFCRHAALKKIERANVML